MEHSERIKEWAENLVNQPLDMNDDYGNLIHSLGCALRQKREEEGDRAAVDATDHAQNEPKQRSTTEAKPKTIRTACVKCHERKVKCNISTDGSPCSNCVKAGRLDCRLHERRKREPKTKQASIADMQLQSSQDSREASTRHQDACAGMTSETELMDDDTKVQK